jgi:O-antigen/teichoic acid export membrane protein
VIADRASWLLILPLIHFNVSRDLAFVIPILAGLVLHAYLGMRLLPISKKLKLQDSNLTALNIFSKSHHFGIIGISSVISNLDGFAVGITSTLESSGSYVLAQRFRNPLTIVFNSIAIRIKPVAALRDRKKIISALKADLYLILTGTLSVLLGSLLAFFYSADIFGPEYIGIEKILAIGTLSSLPLGFVLIATGLLTSIGNEMYVARATWFYAASLMFNVVLGVQYLGALGGVVGSCLTISVYSLIICIKLKKELGNLL